MTEPSDKAVEAAAEAMYDWASNATAADGDGMDWFRAEARSALQAAYPIIEADIRAKIAAEIEASRDSEIRWGRTYKDALTYASSIARGEASA